MPKTTIRHSQCSTRPCAGLAVLQTDVCAEVVMPQSSRFSTHGLVQAQPTMLHSSRFRYLPAHKQWADPKKPMGHTASLGEQLAVRLLPVCSPRPKLLPLVGHLMCCAARPGDSPSCATAQKAAAHSTQPSLRSSFPRSPPHGMSQPCALIKKFLQH